MAGGGVSLTAAVTACGADCVGAASCAAWVAASTSAAGAATGGAGGGTTIACGCAFCTGAAGVAARALAASAMTITGGKAMEESLTRESFVDTIRLLRAGLDVAPGLSVLWSLNPTGRIIYPGTDRPENTWHIQYGTAGKSVVTPVAATDYQFNSEADGTGTDKTAQVAIEDFTSYGGGASIQWNNLDSSPLYAMRAEVRGQR